MVGLRFLRLDASHAFPRVATGATHTIGPSLFLVELHGRGFVWEAFVEGVEADVIGFLVSNYIAMLTGSQAFCLIICVIPQRN